MTLGCKHSFISVMMSKPSTKGVKDTLPLQAGDISSPEKLGYSYLKEENPKSGLRNEVTVLGTIQILCCLLILSLGAILVSAPYPSHFNKAVSTLWMSGYPFVGALCFAITGTLSIISGRKATKPFALRSLAANSASTVAAAAGIFFLADSLQSLGTASWLCETERHQLSSLPYLRDYDATYEGQDCFLAGVSLRGALVVMLVFTVLELFLAAFSTLLWWKQAHSNSPERTSCWPQSQDHKQQGKNSSVSWV